MVHRRPRAGADGDVARGDGIRRRLEQRGIDDPEEAPRRLVDEPAAPSGGRPAAGRGRTWSRRPPKNTQSPGWAPAWLDHRGRSPPSERFLATGPPRIPSWDQDVGQATGTALLGPVLPGVELFARLSCAAGL